MNPEANPVKPEIDTRSPAEKAREARALARKAQDVAKKAKKKKKPAAKKQIKPVEKKLAPSVHSKKTPSAQKPKPSKPSPQPRNTSNITPTVEIASELQAAFDHFNGTLFAGMDLPQCVLSLVRLKKAAGHFWPKQWARDRSKTGGFHEIGLDPIVLRDRTDKIGLSTLAHEMVHLLLEVRGEGPKRSYHCKKWATAMKAIGLQPIAVVKGSPVEGKETGANCTHEIVKGGEFEAAAYALLEKGFKFSWSALPVPKPEPKAKKKKAGVKVKYTCTCCDTSFWGKGGIKATCQEGGEDFVQQGGDTDEGGDDA